MLIICKKVKNSEILLPAFFKHNNSFIATVKCQDRSKAFLSQQKRIAVFNKASPKMRPTFVILCLLLALKSNVWAERSYGYAKKEDLCNLDGLCINFLLEVTDLVVSKNECYLKCLRNLDCAWYTYNLEFGTCHLNMGCNDVVLLNQGFTRSHIDCEVLKSKQKSIVHKK